MICTNKLQFSKIKVCENIKKLKERKWKHMKKLVKKIVVAVLAMAMAIGMLAVSASAATDPGKLYVVGAMSGWSFVEMEKAGNGVYTYTFEDVTPGEVEYKFTLQDAWTNEVSPVGGGNFKTTVGDDGKITFTVDFNKLSDPVDNGGNARYEVAEGSDAIYFTVPTGDATPYIAVAAVAVLALGAVVVLASKKKVVTE